jgi:hypothetical protein
MTPTEYEDVKNIKSLRPVADSHLLLLERRLLRTSSKRHAGKNAEKRKVPVTRDFRETMKDRVLEVDHIQVEAALRLRLRFSAQRMTGCHSRMVPFA